MSRGNSVSQRKTTRESGPVGQQTRTSCPAVVVIRFTTAFPEVKREPCRSVDLSPYPSWSIKMRLGSSASSASGCEFLRGGSGLSVARTGEAESSSNEPRPSARALPRKARREGEFVKLKVLIGDMVRAIMVGRESSRSQRRNYCLGHGNGFDAAV